MNTFTKRTPSLPLHATSRPWSAQDEWGCLFFLAALAFTARLICWSQIPMIWTDEGWYVRWAQDIAAGRNFDVFTEAYKGQPLLPLLLAPICRIAADPPSAASLVTVALGVLTIIPIHLCARVLGGRPAALWSDLLYALSPFAIEYSAHALTHVPFNLFFMLALLFLLHTQRTGRDLWSWLAGAAAWGCYMVRPEGFVLWAYLLAIALLTGGKARLRSLVGFASSFLLLCIPLWIWIKHNTGVWQLAWTAGPGASGLMFLRYPKDSTPLTFILHYSGAVVGALRRLDELWPFATWLLAAFGVIKIWQKKSRRKSVLLILGFASFPLFFYPLWIAAPRLFQPVACSAILFAGVALYRTCDYIHARSRLAKAPVIAACAVLLCLNFLHGYRLIALHNRELSLEPKEIGEWIRRNAAGPQVILGGELRCAVYAQEACNRFVRLARPSLQRIERVGWKQFLEEEGITMVVVNQFDFRWKPAVFRDLMEKPPDILRPILVQNVKTGEFLLYRVGGDNGEVRPPNGLVLQPRLN